MNHIHSSEERIQFLFCEYNKNIKTFSSQKLIQGNINVLISEIAKLHKKHQLYWITNIILLAIKKRSFRLKHGDGIRLKSYWILIHLYNFFPKSIYFILRELPYIGSWADLNNIYKIVFDDLQHLKQKKTPNIIENQKCIKMNEALLDNIVDVWCLQIDKDKRFLNKSHPTKFESVSFMGKWLPRESGSLHRHTKVVNHILKKYDPLMWSKNRNMTKKIYRKFVAECNQSLNTTEVMMCSKSFSSIDFSSVSKKCLYKHQNAWLDETENGTRRHPNDKDRNIARDNYLEYINNTESHPKGSIDISVAKEKCTIIDILSNKMYNPYRHLVEYANEVEDYYTKIDINPHYNENYLNNYIVKSNN